MRLLITFMLIFLLITLNCTHLLGLSRALSTAWQSCWYIRFSGMSATSRTLLPVLTDLYFAFSDFIGAAVGFRKSGMNGGLVFSELLLPSADSADVSSSSVSSSSSLSSPEYNLKYEKKWLSYWKTYHAFNWKSIKCEIKVYFNSTYA